MTDDRCAISVEGDEGWLQCPNRATGRGLCDEHRAEIAKAYSDSRSHKEASELAKRVNAATSYITELPGEVWVSLKGARDAGIPDNEGDIVQDEHGTWRAVKRGATTIYITVNAQPAVFRCRFAKDGEP